MILIDHIYSVFNAGGTAGFESYKNSGSSQTKLLFCRDELFILLKWAFCLDDPGSKKSVPYGAADRIPGSRIHMGH